MIIVPGKNPLGNVIHVIIGPESELISDIHGAVIMDITETISQLTKGDNDKIFISVSKTRNEMASMAQMKSAGLVFTSSIGPAVNTDCKSCENENCTAKKEAPAALPSHKNTELMVALKQGICDYCKSDTKLLPVPGVKVCLTCAQIEFGRKHE